MAASISNIMIILHLGWNDNNLELWGERSLNGTLAPSKTRKSSVFFSPFDPGTDTLLEACRNAGFDSACISTTSKTRTVWLPIAWMVPLPSSSLKQHLSNDTQHQQLHSWMISVFSLKSASEVGLRIMAGETFSSLSESRANDIDEDKCF